MRRFAAFAQDNLECNLLYLFDKQLAASRRYEKTEAPHFFDRISGWKKDLPITNLRGFGVLRNDAAWHLTTGCIDFMPYAFDANDVTSRTPHSFGFNIFIETEKALPIIQEALKSGVLRLPGERPIVLFASHKTTHMHFRDHFHWHGEDSDQRNITLSTHLDGLPEDIEVAGARLDSELKSSPNPFSSAADLCGKLGLPTKATDRGKLALCAHGPLIIDRERASLREGNLSLKVNAAINIDIDSVTVCYTSQKSLADKGQLNYIGRVEGQLEFAVDGLQGGEYEVFANYAGDNVDKTVVTGSAKYFSPIVSIFEQIDPALGTLRQRLLAENEESASASSLEAATALLFSMLGFSILPLYVGIELDDAPDVVAVTPNQNVALVECSLVDQDSRAKIDKLVRRAKQAHDLLRKNGVDGSRVLPIIVSALTKNRLTVTLQTAAEHNVCVVAKEELEEVLAMVLNATAAEQVFEKLEREIKFKNSPTLPGTRYKVAMSFPGERRQYVSATVDALQPHLPPDSIFYDYDHQAHFARPNLGRFLQDVYRNKADLVVVFLCQEYSVKQWCDLEWRAIRDLIKHEKDDQIMFVRFDDAPVEGVLSVDGYIDARVHSPEQLAKFILQRIQS